MAKNETIQMFKEKVPEWYKMILKIKKNKFIPKQWNPEWYANLNENNFIMREFYTRNIGFPIVERCWTKPLAYWMKSQFPNQDVHCLELFAGTGYIAYALQLYNIKFKCIDDLSWQMDNYPEWRRHYHAIQRKKNCFDGLDAYLDESEFVLISWPVYQDNAAAQCLKIIKQRKPTTRIIYIGELWGGCCADDEFFDLIDAYTIPGATDNYHSWWGINDLLVELKFK